MSSHVFVPESEGSLKVTRSLGDSPFHKDDAVSAAPGVVHIPLSASMRFVVIASDGVWDHLSNDSVVSIVAEAIRSAQASAPPLQTESSTPSQPPVAAAAACDAVLRRIREGQASGELGSHVDDQSIVVAILQVEESGGKGLTKTPTPPKGVLVG